MPKSLKADKMTIVARQCVVVANCISMPTTANWYILYLAAIAIDAMCVRRGMAGIAIDLGIGKSIHRYLLDSKKGPDGFSIRGSRFYLHGDSK